MLRLLLADSFGVSATSTTMMLSKRLVLSHPLLQNACHSFQSDLKTSCNVCLQIYDLLMMNYVEDDDAMFRYDPSHSTNRETLSMRTLVLLMHEQ